MFSPSTDADNSSITSPHDNSPARMLPRTALLPVFLVRWHCESVLSDKPVLEGKVHWMLQQQQQQKVWWKTTVISLQLRCKLISPSLHCVAAHKWIQIISSANKIPRKLWKLLQCEKGFKVVAPRPCPLLHEALTFSRRGGVDGTCKRRKWQKRVDR